MAGLELEEQVIRRLMKISVRCESTTCQSILREGRAEGLAQDRAVGARTLVLKLLTSKLGTVSPVLTIKVNALSLEYLEALGGGSVRFYKG